MGIGVILQYSVEVIILLCCYYFQHGKKGKKKSKSKANGNVNEGVEPSQPAISTLLDFDLGPVAPVPATTRFKPLAEDGNLKMVCVCMHVCISVCACMHM